MGLIRWHACVRRRLGLQFDLIRRDSGRVTGIGNVPEFLGPAERTAAMGSPDPSNPRERSREKLLSVV